MRIKLPSKNSIVLRVGLLIFVAMLLQILAVVGVSFFVELPTTLESYAFGMFEKTVENRTNYISGEMLYSWSNIAGYKPALLESYDTHFMREDTENPIEDPTDLFLEESLSVLMEMMRASGTTGAFIILNDAEDLHGSHSGLYISSYNPIFKSSDDSMSVEMVFGPSDIAKNYNIPLISYWSYGVALSEEHQPILTEPLRAATLTQEDKYMGYWHVSTSLSNPNLQVLTYSLPLLDEQGNVLGVIGTEVSQEHLYRHLPFDELTQEDSYGYTIASVDPQMGKLTPLISQGTIQKSVFQISQPIDTDTLESKYGCLVMDSSLGDVAMYAAHIPLYSSNTPFEDESFYLVGLASISSIAGASVNLSNMLIVVAVLSIVIGIVTAYISGYIFSRPIMKLNQEVITSNPLENVSFQRTGVLEIDNLSSSIEDLNRSVVQWVTKSDKILQMTRIKIGTFEYKKGVDFVTVSSTLNKMLELKSVSDNRYAVLTDDFFSVLNDIKNHPEGSMENTYLVNSSPNTWLRITETLTPDGILGVVVDVTKEVLERRALSYERDYDMLTGINNRLAFRRKATDVFTNGNLGVAAVAMFDLDNLKYVNDTFGHDIGDIYIRTAAKVLGDVLPSNTIIGRMSGDEFFAFFYNFISKEEILIHLKNIYKAFDNDPIVLLDGSEFKIRMSGGVAWYGEDSKDFDELIRFADFAMYEGKHTVKGELRMFDKEVYMAESFMLSGKEELNRILDNQFVEYAFQPIIDAKTGDLYAYEALMRPQSEVLNTPLKLLQIAAAQSQLWKIERITFFKTMSTYVRYKDMFGDAKLFINSIPSEVLKDNEYIEFERLYSEHLPNLVVEIIENERLSPENFKYKLEKIHSWGSQVALDDYGSGYNSDLSLLNINPHIIKLDRSLISYVESDTTRQALVDKIINFCRERGMLVLAEGVETTAQMQYLISVGVDLLQGYYVARPMELPNFDNTVIKKEIEKLMGAMVD